MKLQACRIFLAWSRTVAVIMLSMSLVPTSMTNNFYWKHTIWLQWKIPPCNAARSIRKVVYFNCLWIFPHISEVTTGSYSQLPMASLFSQLSFQNGLNVSWRKLFAVIWLLLHRMLSWSTHPISLVFGGRSCFALTFHSHNRMTGMNICNLLFYIACSQTLSNLCLEIAS